MLRMHTVSFATMRPAGAYAMRIRRSLEKVNLERLIRYAK